MEQSLWLEDRLPYNFHRLQSHFLSNLSCSSSSMFSYSVYLPLLKCIGYPPVQTLLTPSPFQTLLTPSPYGALPTLALQEGIILHT